MTYPLTGDPQTELHVAQQIRDGLLPSPWQYENSTFFALRITGTGVSYRAGRKEFVFRDPAIFLAPEFVQRCNGLPVIWEHPPKDTLDSEEFGKRVIGTVTLPYVKGDEVWAIARIIDQDAAQAMADNRLSTSPAVVFAAPSENEVVQGDDGSTLIVESVPSLLDHIAICELGVWDKDGEPTGVNTGEPDVSEETLNKILKAVEDIGGRVDKLEARRDRLRSDRLRADLGNEEHGVRGQYARPPGEQEDEDEEERKRGDQVVWSQISNAEMPKRIGDTKKRFDDDAKYRLSNDARKALDKYCDERKDDDDDARKARSDASKLLHDDDRRHRDDRRRRDAEERRRDAEERQSMLEDPGKPRETAADSAVREQRESIKKAEYQSRADSVACALGMRAPQDMVGERPDTYRRRLLSLFRHHSPLYKNVDLATINTPDLLHAAEEVIYADAMAASNNLGPTLAAGGLLREIKRRDSTGREISEFVGDSLCWMSAFMMPRRRVTKFLTRQSGPMQE